MPDPYAHGRHLSAADPHEHEETPPMSDRPKPITDAVKYVGSGISAVLGVVQTLVLLGVLSNEQAAQINQLGVAVGDATPLLADATSTIVAVVGGLITIATGVLASLGVAKSAQSKVTPVESPRDAEGNVLVTVGPVA